MYCEMDAKKADRRIRALIENGISSGHRSMFVIVGENARNQVVTLHRMLSKSNLKIRPTVLWCYKKELRFNTHRKKKKKTIEKIALNEEDPFEQFLEMTKIKYYCYSETQSIFSRMFGMVILQDFEALTSNVLAQTIETVKGGGLILILLQSLSSLEQLHTLAMDVHSLYQTKADQDIVCRFNKRFTFSLSSCANCLVVDDQLNILPIQSNANKPHPAKHMDDSNAPEEGEAELLQLKESFKDTPPVGELVNLCKTADQAKAVLKFIDALSEKALRTTVSLTSARGRGKSAALGIAVAAAIAFDYIHIYVTSPNPENLKTFFSFLLKGFDVLGYKDGDDYGVIQSTNPDFKKAIVRVNILRKNRQTVQYIHPTDVDKLCQARLVVIDEAAAIPLPFVKKFFGPHPVFMASTIKGYEGTGRSLSLKLLNHVRQQTTSMGDSAANELSLTGRTLHEIELNESIRYCSGDPVESWLNRVLCLDATIVPRIYSGCPHPDECELYYINRDTLFSCRKVAEDFLQRLVGVLVSSHYQNSSNDLMMMADAPDHHLFCLFPAMDKNTKNLPEILCILQICLEDQLSDTTISSGEDQGKCPTWDFISQTVSHEFNNREFLRLSGARIIRIATHPDYLHMGYGSRALQLLKDYYEGEMTMLIDIPTSVSAALENETENPSQESLPPLLLKLSERLPEKVDYIGVSYGLTSDLLKFWKKAGYVVVSLSKSSDSLTQEHSCIMLKAMENPSLASTSWLSEFWSEFRKDYLLLLSWFFHSFPSNLALSVLHNTIIQEYEIYHLTKEEIHHHINPYGLQRLEKYCQNLSDFHRISDLVPVLAKFYFLKRFTDITLPRTQEAILLCLGLQGKSIEQTGKDLELPSSQLMGLFNRTVMKLTKFLTNLVEKEIESTMVVERNIDMRPTEISLNEELAEAAKDYETQQKANASKLKGIDFSEYAIAGNEDEWEKALRGKRQTLVSIKSTKRKTNITENVYKPEKKRKSFSQKKRKRH